MATRNLNPCPDCGIDQPIRPAECPDASGWTRCAVAHFTVTKCDCKEKKMTDAEAFETFEGGVVYYHGSMVGAHGFAKAYGPYDGRYRLHLLDDGHRDSPTLFGARRKSFTVVSVPEFNEPNAQMFKHPLTGNVRKAADEYTADTLREMGYESE